MFAKGGECCSRLTPERVVVGRVGRAHGLDGAFVVDDPTQNETLFAPGAHIFVEGVAAVVEEQKRAGGRLVVRLDRRVTRGVPLEVPRDDLPELAEDEYYVFELIGFDVMEEGGRQLGEVRDVSPAPANDVLELDTGHALPMVEDCVLQVDLDARRILVARGFADAE